MSNAKQTGRRKAEVQASTPAPESKPGNSILRTHLLVDRALSVHFHDLVATALLGAEDSELRIICGRLVAQNQQWQCRLVAMMSDASTGNGRVLATTSPGGSLRVEVRNLARLAGQAASVQPMLIMVKSNTFDPHARRVALYFGLSRRETEILESICGGLRIKEFAANETIATETARKQLKSMLRKLGVGYQVDAVRLVYQTYFEESMAA